jgi:hypothetical protein
MRFPESSSDPLLAAVIRRCRDISLGTVWWVEETLWIEKLPSGYSSDRYEHPGVSLWREPRQECLGAVPMLYGSSEPPKKGGETACLAYDLSRDYPPSHRTYFQSFGPVHGPIPLESQEFLESWYRTPRVRPNWHKRKLETEEIVPLEAWMVRKGL